MGAGTIYKGKNWVCNLCNSRDVGDEKELH